MLPEPIGNLVDILDPDTFIVYRTCCACGGYKEETVNYNQLTTHEALTAASILAREEIQYGYE